MSATGTPLLEFGDFVLATKPHKITPTTEILNDTARNYYFLGDMLKGRGNDEVVQNGSSIIDNVRLDKRSSFQFYHPNEDLQPSGSDVLTRLTAPWRFAVANFAYTNEQVHLNGSDQMNNWTRQLTAWRGALAQDIWDGMEEALWLTPDQTQMEDQNGKTAYSIPTFVTDDGLAPAGFTTIMGVNPASKSNWRNQVEEYDATSADTIADTLFSAFDAMWLKLRWKKPAGDVSTWFKETDWSKFKIATDVNGVKEFTRQLRAANDRLVVAADAGNYSEPSYNGIAIEPVTVLDEQDWANPKFYWLDLRYLFPIFHTDRYMYEEDPIRGGVNQPFSWAIYNNTYYNLFCRSRRRQGIIVAG